MRKKKLKEIPKDIQEVQALFEHLRKTRMKLGPIPEELWQAAVSLAEKYGICRVAGCLHLNVASLRRRVEQAIRTCSRPLESSESSKTEFMELTPASFFTAPQPSQSVVEFVGTDGAQLIFRLSPDQSIDLLEISNAFWRRET